MAETVEEFLAVYGWPDADYPVFDLSEVHTQETVIVRFGDKAVVIDALAIAAGTPDEHLCIDVFPFDGGHTARACALGTENGTRYDGFGDETPGYPQGLPATRCVSVLIGHQS